MLRRIELKNVIENVSFEIFLIYFYQLNVIFGLYSLIVKSLLILIVIEM